MDGFEFTFEYNKYLIYLEGVVKPKHLHIVRKLRKIDPFKIINSDTYFHDESSSMGFVYTIFVGIINQQIENKIESIINNFQNNNTLDKEQNMESMEFVVRYHQFLNEISELVKDEYQPIIQELKEVDPHDLVLPETWFPDINYARGSVWKLFIHTVKSKRKMDLE